MSTILKALRRLEQEKTTVSEGRPLREEVASRAGGPPAPGGAARRWAPAAGALLLGLLAGGVVFWGVNALLGTGGAGETPAAVASGAVGGPTPAAAAPPSPSPSPEPAATGHAPPDEAFASDVQVVPRRKASPRIADAEPINPHRAERPGAHRPVERSAAAHARQVEEMRRALEVAQAERAAAAPPSRPSPPPARAPDPAPAEEPATAATPPPAPAPSAASGSAPSARRAPAPPPEPQQASSPAEPSAPEPADAEAADAAAKAPPSPPAPDLAAEVDVERTQWHPLPDRRRAWIVVGSGETRSVVEGDVVEGMIVSKIEPSGVVFERNGESLRRAIGAH